MSLINQVLRDLQQRQIAPVKAGLQAQISPVEPAARSVRFSYVLLAGVLLIFVALIPFALDLIEGPQPAADTVTTVVESRMSQAATMVALPGVHLTAVRLETAAKSSRLLLEFSQAPGLEPKMLMDRRRMRVLLPELITTARQLPQSGLNDALVGRLSLRKIDHLWQLQVDFNADVRVETVPIKADLLHGERLAFDIFPLSAEIPPIENKLRVDVPLPVPAPETLPREVSRKVTPEAVLTKQKHVPSVLEKVQNLYLAGIAAHQKGYGEEATALWLRALRLHPQHLMARKRAIFVLLSSDRRLADELFSAGVVLHDSLSFSKWYARSLLSVAGPVEALKVLVKQRVKVEEDAEYVALQAALWQQAGEYSKSKSAYRELMSNDPEKSIYRFGLAVALDQQGQGDEAQIHYRKALNGLEEHSQRYARQRIEALAASGVGH